MTSEVFYPGSANLFHNFFSVLPQALLMLFFFVAEIYYLAWHLMLAWSFELGMRLGYFGLATVDKKVLSKQKTF